MKIDNDFIKVSGAREHNLKNISLSIPKNKFVVFTGVSGSGKSSLAFDTIFAEGQRRYVESLSSYARQFLGVMGKPDVDHIDGLSPAISIDQKSVSSNPRSTVGTITEIYDYLRVLYARIGHPHCPNCGTEIKKLTTDEITQQLWGEITTTVKKNKKGVHFSLLSPVVRGRKGEYIELFANLVSKGFDVAFVDGKKVDIAVAPVLDRNKKHDINVIISTLHIDASSIKDPKAFQSRLHESVELSISLSDGLVMLQSDKNNLLMLSTRFSCVHCNITLPELEPRLFSFNSPIGACVACDGLGFEMKISPDLVLNEKLSIAEGGIVPYSNLMYTDTWISRSLKTVFQQEGIDTNIPIMDFGAEQKKILLYGTGKEYIVHGTNRHGEMTSIRERFDGIIGHLHERMMDSNSDYMRFEVERFMRRLTCEVCLGKKLKPEVLGVKIHNKNIFDLCDISIDNLIEFFMNLPNSLTKFETELSITVREEIVSRLNFLSNVGLSYLSLGRAAGSLSGGESQRIRLASQIGSGLSGVLYVLDEPSIGLHPKDVGALIESLKNLRNLGNTLIVAEHDMETIAAADHVVDFGPRAGKFGGRVVFNGSVPELKKAKNSLTGSYLSKRSKIDIKKDSHRKPMSFLSLKGCSEHNLKNISVDIPISCLTSISGVSGSGKSTLIVDTLYNGLKSTLGYMVKSQIGQYSSMLGYQYIDNVYLVDQTPIGRTPRSNPVTYIGAFDYIRDLFAQTPVSREKGFKKGRFSFNVPGGRCEKCQGGGSIKIEMQFLPDVYIRCDVCKGERYNNQTLSITYKDKTISEVLRMTVSEALDFFKSQPLLYNKLLYLDRVGLGYVELGQPAPTLSGGEAQRIKLANELSKKSTGRTMYILDEPTTGLHSFDVEKLLIALEALVDRGNTVVVIEHNLDVIQNSDYVIDLGPEGGDLGGNVLYQGPVSGLKRHAQSYTAKYLGKTY